MHLVEITADPRADLYRLDRYGLAGELLEFGHRFAAGFFDKNFRRFGLGLFGLFGPFGPSGLKTGVGLVLDLGSPQQIGSVTVRTVGATDFEVRAANERGASLGDYTPVDLPVRNAVGRAVVVPSKELHARYVAEIWWQIGNWHFDQTDPRGGPYNLNRAASAYVHSMQFKKPPLFGVARYKLAWTYFKQQRYETSVRAFIDLLRYTDAEEKRTGDPGAD
jgi:hypothetical protein